MRSGKPRLSLIWAQDEQGLIGRDQGLPWQLPADMAWFRKHTIGKPVLMGRKTFESIGRPLPDRKNIVITRQSMQIPGCLVVGSIAEALQLAADQQELMVMGGARLYAQTLDMADRLYLTLIHARFAGDTYFPVFDRNRWRECFREDHAPDERNAYAYSFIILERA